MGRFPRAGAQASGGVENLTPARPPSFVAACLAALGGSFLAWMLVGFLLAPFTLLAWTALALSPDPGAAWPRLAALWLGALAAQLLLAAGIVRFSLRLFDAGSVSYARACAAMLLGLATTAFSALALPASAALPLVGYAWTGALGAAIVLSGGRSSPVESRG